MQFMREKTASYVAACAFVGAALVIRLPLRAVFTDEGSFLLFLTAVMGAAWFGGFGPGLLASILSGLAVNYFFMDPVNRIGFRDKTQAFEQALYLCEGLVISVLAESLHVARRRVEAAGAAAQRLEKAILEISDDERRRVGHDLHDGLGQHLTAAAFMGKALERKLGAQGAVEAADAAQVLAMINESIGWTRDLARGLAPVALDADGLQSALELLATNTSRATLIECTFDPTPFELKLGQDVALHLYRIAQEAVNNAVKHSGARRVNISLDQTDQGLTMQIYDDGRGIGLGEPGVTSEEIPHPPMLGVTAVGPSMVGAGIFQSQLAADGMGLQIMRYRAKIIGASLAIERNAAANALGGLPIVAPAVSGTAVTCTLPAESGAIESRA